MTLTVDAVKNARKELDVALKDIAKKTGIDFTVGRITYDSTGMRCKIEGTLRGAVGTPKSAPADKYLVELLKLKEYDVFLLPKNFEHTKSYKDAGLGLVKIVGYNRRAHAYPFIVQSLKNAKKYKFTNESVSNLVEA
jgi:hypothetical protein